ncbi:hypothetical protein G6M26_13000 [Agrobacterium tumefaciens]|nr:hypothetical protein [Agrobacterium tumefaciens]NTC16169.1 hypothetical protein [Agrobacterium tumefaciens]NTD95971.1 hypothetical protein [Agrobacterium tumefaciens]NTE19444.1 hypothetical protein [Agrobacterium tumefaciens]
MFSNSSVVQASIIFCDAQRSSVALLNNPSPARHKAGPIGALCQSHYAPQAAQKRNFTMRRHNMARRLLHSFTPRIHLSLQTHRHAESAHPAPQKSIPIFAPML